MTTPSLYSQTGLIIEVYQPIKFSNRGYLCSLHDRITSYSHSKGLVGGDLRCSLSFTAKVSEMEEWFEEGVGRDIEVRDASGLKVFSGFVNQVRVDVGGRQEIRGPLLEVRNKVMVVYSTIDYSVTPPALGVRTRTSYSQDTLSQSRFGILTSVLSVGGSTDTVASRYRDAYLSSQKYPKSSSTISSRTSTPTITLDIQGYWNYLEASIYNTTSSGSVNLSTKLTSIINAEPNSIFTPEYIQTNTFGVSAWEDEDRISKDLIQGLLELGDASNNIYSFLVTDRGKCYYQRVPLPEDAFYTYSCIEGTLYTPSGSPILPWTIQPAQWIFTKDWMLGACSKEASLQDDPRYRLIQEVQYTAPFDWTVNGNKALTSDYILAKLQLGGL